MHEIIKLNIGYLFIYLINYFI